MSLALTFCLNGCGNAPGGSADPLFVTDCGAAIEETTQNLVSLQWGGGTTPIYPGETFDAIDLRAFPITGGGTLADRGEEFENAVTSEVKAIYCAFEDQSVVIAKRGEIAPPSATVILITQSLSPVGGGMIGEAEYDPCNQFMSNTGLIYGEQIRRLRTEFTFDEWVAIFANTIAHEIGHTLGYGHISRLEQPDPERSLFVELMLDRHTIDELKRPHRFVVKQSDCPGETAKASEPDVIECGHHHDQ